MLTMAAVLTILVMILGVSGNLLTIVALLRCPRVRNVAAAFIIRSVPPDSRTLSCVDVEPWSRGSGELEFGSLKPVLLFCRSLCVADLLFCVTVLPFSASRFIHGTWTHGGALCTVVPFMRYGNVGVSLLSIAMITVNRCASPAWPEQTHCQHSDSSRDLGAQQKPTCKNVDVMATPCLSHQSAEDERR